MQKFVKMNTEGNDIDNYFKEALDNLQVPPPPDVWGNIERKLDKKRKIYLLSIWTSLAAGIALLIGLGIFFERPASKITITQTTSSHVKPVQQKTSPKGILHNPEASSSNTAKNLAINVSPPEKIVVKGKHEIQFLNADSLHENAMHQQVPGTSSENPPAMNTEAGGADNTQIASAGNTNKENVKLFSPKALSNYLKNSYTMIDTTAGKTKIEKPVVYDHLEIYDEVAEAPKVQRWGLEGQVAPLYSYRNITGSGYEDAKSYFNNTESGIVSYAGVVKINYHVNKRLMVQAGVSYAVLGYANNDVSVITQYSFDEGKNAALSPPTKKNIYLVNNSSGKISLSPALSKSFIAYKIAVSTATLSALSADDASNTKIDAQSVQQFQIVEFPVLARYIVIDRKALSMHLIGGLSTNMLVSANNYVKEGGNVSKVGSNNDLNSFNYSSTFGFGVGYKLQHNMNLILEPSCKYFLNSISTNGYNVHPYAFGIYTGLNFTF